MTEIRIRKEVASQEAVECALDQMLGRGASVATSPSVDPSVRRYLELVQYQRRAIREIAGVDDRVATELAVVPERLEDIGRWISPRVDRRRRAHLADALVEAAFGVLSMDESFRARSKAGGGNDAPPNFELAHAEARRGAARCELLSLAAFLQERAPGIWLEDEAKRIETARRLIVAAKEVAGDACPRVTDAEVHWEWYHGDAQAVGPMLGRAVNARCSERRRGMRMANLATWIADRGDLQAAVRWTRRALEHHPHNAMGARNAATWSVFLGEQALARSFGNHLHHHSSADSLDRVLVPHELDRVCQLIRERVQSSMPWERITGQLDQVLFRVDASGARP